MKNISIPYMQIRGGSSKGIYFNKKDLPSDADIRDTVVLDIVGRDERQIDGLGGANPLTSKVAIINKSTEKSIDIDYLFMQVVVGQGRVDIAPNCGNILAGVGIFAIQNNIISTTHPTTKIKVKMLNSGSVCELIMQTPNGILKTTGETKIDGVDGTSASIICNYLNISGSICGSLFPTGNKKDQIDGINITCIDNGMPVVLIKAEELKKTGYESCEELNNDLLLKQKLEKIRIKAGHMMNLDDVSDKSIPKMCLISLPIGSGNINTRTFIPHKCHSAIGVLGAVSVASACLYSGCVTDSICEITTEKESAKLVVEHPSGSFEVNLAYQLSEKEPTIYSAGIVRTARLISEGKAYPYENN